VNTLVLGGGVAGLSAAYFSGAAVYEAAPVLGGVASSKQIDGFSFDYGIHVLQTEQESLLDQLAKWNVSFDHRRRHAMVYSHGTYTPYPFQINTAGLPLRLRLQCLWHYFRRDKNAESDNYREWINHNIGKGFADTFLIPYSQKFWTVDPAEMTCDWTNNRVPETSIWQVLRGAVISTQSNAGTNAKFRYPNHGTGYGALPDGMAGSVPNAFVNHRATCIDTDRYIVEFNNGATCLEYETIISTIPLPDLIKIIPQAPDEVREAAQDLKANSIYVVNLGIDRPEISPSHWIHYPEPDISFFRISFPHNMGQGLVPENKSAISAEVAYSPSSPLDKSNIIDRVVEDLHRTGILKQQDKIILTDTMDIRFAYPIYDLNRKKNLRTINAWLEQVGIHPAGRYGLWAYLWSHESILSGKQVGLKVSSRNGSSSSLQTLDC
jgi:protoporphyrinogen oxidase